MKTEKHTISQTIVNCDFEHGDELSIEAELTGLDRRCVEN